MKVYVNYNDNRWKKYKIDFAKIANAAARDLSPEAEVSITLTDDAEIHSLNKQYRNIDKATNVLSFELSDPVLLGDIYISLDTVAREARDLNITVAEHTAHMIVHGVLHLQGYDHIKDEDAEIMEGMEVAILKKLGIKNPYAPESCAYNDCASCPGDGVARFFRRFAFRENGFWQYFLLFVLGGVTALGFAPFYMWWIALPALGAAYGIIMRGAGNAGFWRLLWRAFPFGAAYSVAMFWWTLHSIYVVPELASQFAIWTVPALMGLGIAGGFIFGTPFALCARARTTAAARPFVFAGMWTLVLWMREWVFTGFPWNPFANVSMPWPMLANSMSLWGALGLTFIIVGLVASITEVLRNRMRGSAWLSVAIFAVLVFAGGVAGVGNLTRGALQYDADADVIRIVQPAKNQAEKMSYSSRADRIAWAEDNVRNLVRLAAQPGNPDLVVFPETTYPFVVVDDEMPLSHVLGRPVVIGATSFADGRMYNSMIVADAGGNITDIYSKSHLVPFGEYAPLGGLMPSPANLTPGDGARVLSVNVGGNEFLFAPAICYEIIFSDALIPRGTMPSAVINITNDTWFGATPGTYQHLDMVRRYAIESGLPVVRANYSGISAFITSTGAITSMLPVGEVGILDGFVWGAHDTLYRKIGRDYWLIIILAFSSICAFALGWRREK